MIIVGAIAAAAAIVLIVSSLGGSSGAKGTTSAPGAAPPAGTRHAGTHRHASSHGASSSASRSVNPAEVSVAVLNGTETTGLAHRTAGELQQRGYSQASAVGGRPAGASQSTVVQYTGGHRADAEAVSRSLSGASVRPIEEAVSALAGSAKVVVVVGTDRAAASP
jgi:hypothetical protein